MHAHAAALGPPPGTAALAPGDLRLDERELGAHGLLVEPLLQPRDPGREPMLGLTQLSNHLTLKGSFSAVSKPNFASKYSLESSRRDLHNALLCTVIVGSVWVL